MIPELPFARITGVTRTLMTTAGASTSPFTGQQQVQDWGGAWWQYELEFAQTPGDEGRRLAGFFAALGGQSGRFLFRDPTIRPLGAVGAPVVAGAGQAGNTLHTSGWDLAADRWNLISPSEPTLADGAWDAVGMVGDPAPSISDAFLLGRNGLRFTWLGDHSGAAMIVNTIGNPEVIRVRQAVFRVNDPAGVLLQVRIAGALGNPYFPTDNRYHIAVDLQSQQVVYRGSLSSTDPISIEDLGDGCFRIMFPQEWTSSTPVAGAGFMVSLCRRSVNATGSSFQAIANSGDWVEFTMLQSEDGTHVATPYQPIPGVVARASDFFTLGTGANTRLYQLTQDVTPDGDGNATLHFVPPLREHSLDGEALGVDKPKVLLRPTGPIPASIGLANFYRFSLSAREAI